jgi:hypothetical protein
MAIMALVYFSDADKVIHKVPSELTHFEPNDESDPYVLDKLVINTATGLVFEERVRTDYFIAFHDYFDEKATTFRIKKYDEPLPYIGDFVRFIGTAKSVTVIVNYYEHNYVDAHSMVSDRIVGVDCYDSGPIRFEYGTKDGLDMLKASYSTSGKANWKYLWEDVLVDELLDIVDVCQHTREMLKYVKDTTNAIYAGRLKAFLVSTEEILRDVRPYGCGFAMRVLVDHFHKIPQEVRDEWRTP